MGEKDIAQKNFESYNDVVADILNGSLFSGEEVFRADSLIDAQAFSQYKAETGKIHEQERDVAKYCMDMNCNIRLALIGFENQIAIDNDMPLRVIGYDGASYRDELNQAVGEADGKTMFHRKRYPVITLVLYFGKRPWKKPLCLYDVLDIPEKLKPFVNDYKINIIDVPRLTTKQVENYKGDFQIIADYFVQCASGKDYVPNTKKIRHVDSMLKLMSVLTNDDRYTEYIRSDETNKEGLSMCEVLDKVEAKGKAKGEIIGEARGEARGEVRGMEKNRTEMIINMMKENISIDVIARVAKMTVAQVIDIGKKAAVL